jgi:protoheme IX farnesyltransferase
MSARCPVISWQTLLAVTGSLFLAISGSTVLNMVHDRDIDLLMTRTCLRPLPAGRVGVREATILGVLLSAGGVGWALAIDPLYGLVVLAGLFCDVVIYTLWLKRRTAWSIVWGGIAGGMPILAGRALGTGQIEPIGLLLSLAVLLWIPTHIMTFSIRYRQDYARAGIPTFPSTYGVRATQLIIAVSSVGAAAGIMFAAMGLGLTGGYLHVLGVLSAGLLGLALVVVFRPSERRNFGLFKYASAYMLCSMLLVALGSVS